MNRPRLRIALAIVAVQLLAGCDTSPTRLTPLAPSPIPPQTPQQPPQTTLRGFVTDTALRPLAGVNLEIIEGPQVGLSATTAADGQFLITGTVDDTTRVRATKEGHVTATGALTPVCTTCNPSSRYIYFYLSVLAPPISIAGDYTLTITADSACTLPEDVRTRTYSATIAADTNPRNPPNTIFNATVSGAPFFGFYETFFVGVAGDFVTLLFGGHGPSLVEELAPKTYLAFDGLAQTSLGASSPSTITVPFDGVIEYCERRSEMGEYYDCGRDIVARAPCASKNHQLVLKRR